ncbi:MAG: C40 family peptidase [Fibrobacter sp.]|nr:C40 family peptidase [Fibrobacter sp.]
MILSQNSSLFFGIFSAFLLLISGCSPSIRYTRSNRINTGAANVSDSRNPGTYKNRQNRNVPDSDLTRAIKSYLGVPYKYGGMSRKGMDCSGFVTLIYQKVYNIELPRSSREQRRYGKKIPKRKAKPGDLVFFRTARFRGVNHVGIYAGDNRFAHSSLRHGVIYSSLDDDYYAKHLVEIRRIL